MSRIALPRTHRSLSTPAWPVVAVAVAALLLVSYGGGILLAPVTLPLLYMALRRDTTGTRLRFCIVAVAGLTAVEVGWAAAYVTIGEGMPWIWLIPLAAGLTAVAGYARARPAVQTDHSF